jgi:hypothetical protein
MEMPPYGGIDITPEMMQETDTLYGMTWGMEGTECFFPRGYDNLQILEVSDFLPLSEIPKWVNDTSEELGLPERPQKLPDLNSAEKVA